MPGPAVFDHVLAGPDPVSTGIWPWLAAHFLIGLVGTWCARRYAVRRKLIDQPGARRSHDTPTPRGGGIAIVAALMIALAWLAKTAPELLPFHVSAALGLLLVAGVGWMDDHTPLSPWVRLAAHGLAGITLAWGLHAIGAGTVAVACSFGLVLVLVNIWNFMDGIDGIAASQAVLVGAGYALLAGSGTVAWLALALAAACAGFLPFNLPKARIFLGDVGSGAIGFTIAVLASAMLVSEPAKAPVLLLPLCAFAVDATLTLGTRIVRRERWWDAHTSHAYQRWVRRTGRHDVTTWAYAGWTLCAVLVMLMVGNRAPGVMMAALGVTYLAAVAAWWRLQRTADMLETGVRE